MISLLDTEKKILSDVEIYGWHVIKVAKDDVGPSFGYSVGFCHSFQHPEVIIIGLELELTHFLINKIGDAIREGSVIYPGHFYANILKDFNCYFTKVYPQHLKEYANFNEWFYKGHDYSILQCIYPLPSGIFPWQEEWPKELVNQQPILGDHP